ncbi:MULTISPECIES: extracellular solute-binding protein [Caldilinea]|uniref:Putative ABC transporter substrate binding protein n=1 Tax=Caldilinea aerophila (strain DSM 14535 / JCM 11387 / NBRC 104270 / STL-6-O1) TaxID=926550 RepID=I0I7M9_CALAS|nr:MULTISPECIES: extracellular solute-binding protein [Caldilinea]MBO9392806.1 extracellular solute-binding protein [Caldilinea sp.]BAM01267.1 putative ABC transporter substrate binding protein [Caldilinea aerophila DSM 14535 = NBRC 104270]GIV72609.1 MAG: sugar ABC transporter substrate-binding protein [Caldilinea sp.]
MSRFARSLLVVLLVFGILAGCSPGVTIQQPAEPAKTEQLQQVTLKVWDILVNPTEDEVAKQLIAEFEAVHPGVKVERETMTFDQMKSRAKLGLSAADGPDVAQINQGYPDMGALVAANLLVDLTPYAKKYGWDKKFSPGIIARNSFTPDGKNLGEGNLYGAPITAELVGVFYNKEHFERAGVSVPKTFGEFEVALEKIKSAGIVPINYGSLDGFVHIHVFAEIQNLKIGRAYLDDFIYGRNNVSFNIPANVEAAAKMQEWVKKGYFTPDFAGIGYDDSLAAFRAGEGAMMITGSWISGDVIAQAPGKFGFFLMPPLEEGGKRMSTGGTSTAFAIRKGTPNEELAAQYIDWMVSDRAAQLWAEKGIVPVGKVEVQNADPLFVDLLKAWAYLNENDLIGHYLDWATPTFYDTLVASFAELMALKITPEEFVQKVEADYAAYLKSRNQ